MNFINQLAAASLAIMMTAMPVSAQDKAHASHTSPTAGSHMAAVEDTTGAEAVLVAYRAALTARDAGAMTQLFADQSWVFENGKAEGSFANYMEHHLGPELDAITSFTFTKPTVTVTRKGHLAYAHETYTYSIGLNDGRKVEREGVATSVLMHEVDGWRIIQYHSSSRAPRAR